MEKNLYEVTLGEGEGERERKCRVGSPWRYFLGLNDVEEANLIAALPLMLLLLYRWTNRSSDSFPKISRSLAARLRSRE